MENIRTILFAGDFSACSEDAYRVAAALARDCRARLIVLHIMPSSEREGRLHSVGGYRADLENRLCVVYGARRLDRVEYRLQDGEPAAEILRAAQQDACDLIVMGTHGRTGLNRLLLGSVTEAVLRKAVCPVLTVRVAIPISLAADKELRKRAGEVLTSQ
jgi:nucleotide-binding universal stress UspA family protein